MRGAGLDGEKDTYLSLEKGYDMLSPIYEGTLHKNLKPAKNIRFVLPRACVTCQHYKNSECERSGGFNKDPSDLGQYFHVCDYWKLHKRWKFD